MINIKKLAVAFVLAATTAGVGYAVFHGRNSEKNFVPKAYQELEGLYKFLGGTTPPQLKAVAQRSGEVIDQYVDRPAKEKEELKTVAILSLGYPYLFDDTTRFKDEFNQDVSDMVQDLVSGKLTNDTAQISMALSVTDAEMTIEELKKPEVMSQYLTQPMTPEELTAAREKYKTMRAEPEFHSAPRLYDYESKVVNDLLTTLEQAKPVASAAPRAPKLQ